jgi:hypothetical protein
MDQIRKQVARARRRLWLELFLSRLVKCWFLALAAAAIAVAVPKLVAIDNLPAQWNAWWLGGAVATGVVISLAWTWLRGRSELEAAMEIDRRFELKERVASSLSLTPEAAETPAGRALAADALHAVKRLEIDERFRIHLGRAAWLPLAPALLALLLIAFVDSPQAQSSSDPHDHLTKQQRDNAFQNLRKRLAEQRKAPPKKGLKEADDLLLKVDKDLEKLSAKKEMDRKQTLVKLNDLAKELAERRQQLGGDNELRKQLAGMKDLNKGPASKMADAMKNGDWDKAKQELQKLNEQLKTGKLDEKTRKELEKQLSQLQKRLEDARANRQQAMDDLKKQIDQMKRDGKLAEAGDMQQKLDQMKQQQNQMKQLAKMAKQMGECQKCMKNGDQQGAAEAMQQMMQQLDQMAQQGAEGEMLDMAMAQLEMAKDSMACKECEGMGCQACQGNMNANMKMNGRPGMGMGQGIGFGPRPEERNKTGFRDSMVKQNTGRGAAVIAGEAEGPNMRGNVREEIKEEMTSQGSEPADPQVIEQLPKTHRENAEEYFNGLRTGA